MYVSCQHYVLFQVKDVSGGSSVIMRWSTLLLITLVHTRIMSCATLLPQSPLSRSVARRQMAESKLGSQFNTLFRSAIAGSELTDKYLIYKCDEECLTDYKYFHGVTSGFLLAMMMKRRFKLADSGPVSVFDVYDTNVYDWKVTNASAVAGKVVRPFIKTGKPMYRNTEAFVLARELMTMDFDTQYPDQFVYLTNDNDWIRDLRRNPIVSEKFTWICSTPKNDVVRLIYTGLFKISKERKNLLSAVLSKQLNNKKLFCYYGNENGSVANTASVMSLFDSYRAGYRMFVHAQKIERDLFYRNVNDGIITIDDVTAKSKVRGGGKDALNFIMSLEIGTLCDVLVTSNTVQGVVAAILRPTAKDLYCLSHTAHVLSCTREGITRSFRDDISFSPDKWYLRKIYRETQLSWLQDL